MSREALSRRHFLTLPLALILTPVMGVAGERQARRGTYAAEVGILYDLLTLHLTGAIGESIDRSAGRYDVQVVGQGSGIANRMEST